MEAAAAAAPTQHDRDEEDWTGVPETPGYTPGHSSANRSANLDEDEFEGGDFCDYYAVLGLERCCHQDDLKRTSASATRQPGAARRASAPLTRLHRCLRRGVPRQAAAGPPGQERGRRPGRLPPRPAGF